MMPPNTKPNLLQRTYDWIVPKGADPSDMEYMSEVDKALNTKGHPLAFILSLSVLLFFAVFLIWASFASLDEVTHGQGQVIPSQRTQEIQNLEGGILEAMLVQEGQVVHEGQPLLKLSPKIYEANVRDAEARRREHEAALIRMQAELEGATPVFPPDMVKNFPQVVADQMAAFNARKEQFAGEVIALTSEIEQRRREVEEALAKKKQTEDSLRLTIERRDTLRPLVEKKIYSKIDFLSVEQQVTMLRGDLNAITQTISRIQSSVQGAEQKLNNRQSEVRTSVTEEMSKRRSEINSLTETIAATGDRLNRTEILAPVRGTVKRILINTTGGVIKPGETIIELVPLDDTLMVEAKIKPIDIAFIKPGQRAMIKVSAFDFSIYGGLEGEVIDISADTIEDKRGEFYYLVKLRTRKSSIVSREGKELTIIPGMQATVDIITGEKTVLAYLMKPITKARQNALTER